MKRDSLTGLLLFGAGIAALLLYNRGSLSAGVQNVTEDVQAALTGWKAVGAGPIWVPQLNAAEARWSVPQDVLARIAYQESRFRPEVIDGSVASPAGALGLMQLMPRFFTTVQGPRPFTPDVTQQQIEQAAQLLAGLYSHFQDWSLAVAGYNDGRGNIDSYLAGRRQLPQETQNYVAQVNSDVPLTGALVA